MEEFSNFELTCLTRLDHDWTVEEMSVQAGYSPSYFRMIFRKELSASPAAYLKDLRLEKAKYLLENTFEHIKQVGLAVGMTDESHFTRDFKTRYEETPTEHRRTYNNKRHAKWLETQK